MAEENRDMMNIGQLLKTFRKNCNLTQQQVADKLQINRTTYTYYELGKTEPSFENLNKLVKMFGITYEDILPDIDTALVKDPRFGPKGDDFIYKITKEEQDILLQYRILDQEKKEELLEYLNDLPKE